MMDEHVDDLIALYALGALEADEQVAVDQHLDECGRCRRLLTESKELVLLLAWTPDQHDPPPVLRDRLMRRVQQLQRLGADDRQPWWHRLIPDLRRRTPQLAFGLAGVMAVLLLFFGSRAVSLQQEVAVLRAQLSTQQLVVDVLRSPDTRVVALSNQTGGPEGAAQLLLDPARERALLVTSALPRLPQDQTYQLWLIGNNTPESMGTFEVNQQGVASIVVQANRPLNQFQAVGVSIEPEGGSPQPTNVILLEQL